MDSLSSDDQNSTVDELLNTLIELQREPTPRTLGSRNSMMLKLIDIYEKVADDIIARYEDEPQSSPEFVQKVKIILRKLKLFSLVPTKKFFVKKAMTDDDFLPQKTPKFDPLTLLSTSSQVSTEEISKSENLATRLSQVIDLTTTQVEEDDCTPKNSRVDDNTTGERAHHNTTHGEDTKENKDEASCKIVEVDLPRSAPHEDNRENPDAFRFLGNGSNHVDVVLNSQELKNLTMDLDLDEAW